MAGVDEAGRGPLAGPVVAAVVILPEGFRHDLLNDSKQLTERRRDSIFAEIMANGEIRWAHAIVESDVIDRLNIFRATHEACWSLARHRSSMQHSSGTRGAPLWHRGRFVGSA